MVDAIVTIIQFVLLLICIGVLAGIALVLIASWRDYP